MDLDWSDGVFALGVLLVVVGVWWIYPPAALIVAGGVMMALGVLTARGR